MASADVAPAGRGQPRVREAAASDEADWERFVADCPDATFFHRWGWKGLVENVFGHPTRYLIAEGDEGIEGVLPLARIKSWLFGDALFSLPFCVYGGIAAQTDAAARSLDEAAVALAEDMGVGHLEYRHREPRFPDRAVKSTYVTFRGAIHPTADENMKAIPRKQRAMVRKGINGGLVAGIDEGVDRLFDTYAHSVHRLGTPVFPKRYFRALKETFGDDCEVMTVSREGEVLASVMSFYFRDEVIPYYGGGTDRARQFYASDFMYWSLMEHARERGCAVFDFGRSKVDVGSYRFKKHWGFVPEPLHYECRLVRARELPDNSPLNPKYQAFIAAWKRLPRPVVNTLGPHIVRNLG